LAVPEHAVIVFLVGTKLTLKDATGDRLEPEFTVIFPVVALTEKLAPLASELQEWSS